MKGVILAGGHGTRLWPLTAVTNKHILPVWQHPMIHYPLGTLVDAGITDIMVVTGGNNAGAFLPLLGDGAEFGLKGLQYGYQRSAGGIAEALMVAKNFVNGDKCVVILGDNILGDTIRGFVEAFDEQEGGAQIFLKHVSEPWEYGVADRRENGLVHRIVEKPTEYVSNLAVIGVYCYDHRVWEVIPELERSDRGELEVTDLNNWYINCGMMTSEELSCPWADAGSSHESLREASEMARRLDLLSQFKLRVGE